MPWLEDLKFPRGYQMGTHKDKKGKGIQIIYGPQVTVIKSDFEEYVEKVSQ